MLSAISSEILTLDASLPVSDLQTMNVALAYALLPARLAAGAVGSFAVLAAILAAVGLYGAIAYTVSQRVREIAIRRALGANTRMVLWSVIREGAGIVLVGLGIGVTGCLILSRVMPSVLYGVGAVDPVAFATATVALFVVALFAASVSGRKATLIDPVRALRQD